MQTIALVLAYIAYVGHGRRVQVSNDGLNWSNEETSANVVANPSAALTFFLLALNPASAFNPSGRGPIPLTGFSTSNAASFGPLRAFLDSQGRLDCRISRMKQVNMHIIQQAFSPAALPEFRPALLPIVAIIKWCLIGMIPTGALAVLSKKSELHRRVFTGCTLGVVVSLWIFSSTYTFLTVFALMAIIAQNEYFSMARASGCFPTWKLGTLGSCGMYITGCMRSPVLRDALFPLTGTVTIVYLMLRRSALGIEKKTPPLTMNDVSTTFMGIYYLGYMPSFWVRLRQLGPLEPSAVLAQLLPPASAAWKWPVVSQLAASSADFFSCGALVQWWTMFSVVAADVFAYFVGKRFGKTKFVELSPKKTLEGLVAGCLGAMLATTTGAVLMGWPRPLISGAFYGLMVAVMALIGDLTVSMLKRSAGFKDTGSLLPGHGGLLDRIDSFLLVPAPAYFFVRWLLPLIDSV
mmetsp:Transcript_165084/g.292307  ORF Transcript_165084/g.292307 Transcript_165084/m.292307 type:complete len:464 (+) Transcript_165084:102-1493(+)